MALPSGSADTSADAARVQTEIWRAMSPRARLAMVADLNDACDRLAEAGVKARYPDADTTEIRNRVLALKLGRELMIEVYGWDPHEHGW